MEAVAGNYKGCSVDGCDRIHYGRGWCQLHYLRWRSHGDPLFERPKATPHPCSIEGCSGLTGVPGTARGWCSLHYGRWQRSGDPLAVPASRRNRCGANDCDEWAYGWGFCQKHYFRMKRRGTLLLLPHPQDGVPEGQRRCCSCKAIKLLEEFYRAGDRPRSLTCADCARLKTARYRAANPAKVKAYAKRHYAEHREEQKARAQSWRRANPERARETTRIWREANRDWFREIQTRWRDEHPSYFSDWDKANPEKRRAYQLRRGAAMRSATIVPFSGAQLAARLSMFPGCWMCGAEPTEVDHVKPIRKGGLHVLANLRPACRRCNASKSDIWPFALRAVS